MRKSKCVLVVLSLLVLVGGTQAYTTTFWIGQSNSSTPLTGDQLFVPTGQDFTVSVYGTTDFHAAPESIDLVIGYAMSESATYGSGKGPAVTDLTASPVGILQLVSSATELQGSLPNGFAANPVLYGTTRESSALLGGAKWYAFDVSGAATSDPGAMTSAKLLTFTMHNVNCTAQNPGYLRIAPGVTNAEASWISVIKGGSANTKVPDLDGYTLAIVPEPLSMMTLLLGLPMILRRRK